MKRRMFLKTALASAFALSTKDFVKAENHIGRASNALGLNTQKGGSGLRGPLPILSTPYLESGEVDYETLIKEAKFVTNCGCGMIWPQSDDSCDLLTVDEKLKGMEAIAKAMIGSKANVVFGCQGKDAEEMTIYAKHIEHLARNNDVNISVISRPPDNGKTMEDLLSYYKELAKYINRPAIIQTGGGATYQGVMPSVELLLALAKQYPNIFGYIKEESGDCNKRIVEEVANKPLIKCVFSAWGSYQWLYQSRRLGTEGVITERPAYADLIAYIWKQMENGDKHNTLDDAFAKYLLMLNMPQSIPGGDLRGAHLYILKKRGIFKNFLSREFIHKDGKRIIPKQMILKELTFSQGQIDEMESRFASLKSYLQK